MFYGMYFCDSLPLVKYFVAFLTLSSMQCTFMHIAHKYRYSYDGFN